MRRGAFLLTIILSYGQLPLAQPRERLVAVDAQSATFANDQAYDYFVFNPTGQ